MLKSLLDLEVDQFVRLAEIAAALGMSKDNVLASALFDHGRRDLARVGAALFAVHVLRADLDVRSLNSLSCDHQINCRRAENDFDLILSAYQRLQDLDQLKGFLGRLVHLPVTRYDFLTHNLYSFLL